MTTQQKQAIVNEIIRLSKLYATEDGKTNQSKVAIMAGTSTATISQMINQNWDLIKDEMWQRVKINLRIDTDWNNAETTNYVQLTKLLKEVQLRNMSVCIVHNAGTGKSHTYKLYESNFENVIYIECKNYWTKKSYVKQLLIACGLDPFGTVEEMIEKFINKVKKLKKPIIIIDQFDKLKEPSMDLFMDFYNDLDKHCGFVLSGVPALKKRIERGCQNEKIGYDELKSRIGKKYIPLYPIKEKDVQAVCEANGVTDEQFINETFNTCEGDLRRVRRNIDQYFLMQKQ